MIPIFICFLYTTYAPMHFSFALIYNLCIPMSNWPHCWPAACLVPCRPHHGYHAEHIPQTHALPSTSQLRLRPSAPGSQRHRVQSLVMQQEWLESFHVFPWVYDGVAQLFLHSPAAFEGRNYKVLRFDGSTCTSFRFCACLYCPNAVWNYCCQGAHGTTAHTSSTGSTFILQSKTHADGAPYYWNEQPRLQQHITVVFWPGTALHVVVTMTTGNHDHGFLARRLQQRIHPQAKKERERDVCACVVHFYT